MSKYAELFYAVRNFKKIEAENIMLHEELSLKQETIYDYEKVNADLYNELKCLNELYNSLLERVRTKESSLHKELINIMGSVGIIRRL